MKVVLRIRRPGGMMRTRAARVLLLCAIATIAGLALSPAALGFPETAWPGRPEYGDTCHTTNCHAAGYGSGPHAGFSTSTRQCDLCHTLHGAATDYKLLPKQTLTDTCHFCHDGTGGSGVYGTVQARTGTAPSAMHRVLTTNIVPGGDPNGGDSTGTFSEAGGNLGCGDCHSPHGQNCVTPFSGERSRYSMNDIFREGTMTSNRLLRKRPTGGTAEVAEYGSDWCLSCHKGRDSGGGMTINHPVDSSATNADPYVYNRVPRMSSYTATDSVVIASMGRTLWNPSTGRYIRHNLAFVMPTPRVPEQQGHAPICMQCHEDSRSVGAVGAVATATVSGPNGLIATDNPRFQNFPHETVNRRFLVETGDDLCLNCHPSELLP